MSKRGRLIFLGIALLLLIVIGRITTGGFEFLLQQFWFTSGLFLLVLLSLVDQPHFSKDANIFGNGATGWVSLILVPVASRSVVWWLFLVWASYLILSSYMLMWLRSKELGAESKAVQTTSRLNRQIGRPEALFSAFFLWGAVEQFGPSSSQFNALLLFWVVFTILNLPAIAAALEGFVTRPPTEGPRRAGIVLSVTSPRVVEALLSHELDGNQVGKWAVIRASDGTAAGEGVVLDDRTVSGRRLGTIAVTTILESWNKIGDEAVSPATIEILDSPNKSQQGWEPVSVVGAGTDIGRLVFHAHPDLPMQEGEVLWVELSDKKRAFYQVVTGQVTDEPVSEGNYAQSVRVGAGQLGLWDGTYCRFEPVTWVPPAGQLVHRASALSLDKIEVPKGQVIVGKVPNSDFPAHVNLEDIVTHNTAVLGVTGSGKSYLAFHLIESMIANKIKVLILDVSRQHYLFLENLNPTALKKADDVAGWLNSDSVIGIHQYAIDGAGYPQITANFVAEAFKELSKTDLKAGKNEPAKLCVVFEEAHSLIPEWNQVAQDSDKQQVNKTAKIILQGRKYGMGSLIITQRTANVTKTILNQCNTIFALQTFDQTGLDFLKNYMGDEYAHTLSTLPPRHAVLVGKASSSVRPIMFRIQDFSTRWGKEAKKTPSSPQVGHEAPLVQPD